MNRPSGIEDRCAPRPGPHAEGHPDSPAAWNNRGASRLALGDAAGALADFDRAIAVRPDYAEAYNNRGFVRHALGDYPGARADFDRAVAVRPDYAEALSNRGT